jgi:hypothetical protein
MNTVNTRLFSLEELQKKPYGDLLTFIEGLQEVAFDLEDVLEEIENFENEYGYLEPDMINDVPLITTQLEYIKKNINTAICVLNKKEMRSFITFNGYQSICLN